MSCVPIKPKALFTRIPGTNLQSTTLALIPEVCPLPSLSLSEFRFGIETQSQGRQRTMGITPHGSIIFQQAWASSRCGLLCMVADEQHQQLNKSTSFLAQGKHLENRCLLPNSVMLWLDAPFCVDTKPIIMSFMYDCDVYEGS